VDNWKSSFLEKLHRAQEQCARKFSDAIEQSVVPVFDDLAEFLRDNGFTASTPLRESDHRSFKMELAENAYVLMIFRFTGVGEFELRTETFVPGAEPILDKSPCRVVDIDHDWAQRKFHDALDRFVDLLAGQKAAADAEELVAV